MTQTWHRKDFPSVWGACSHCQMSKGGRKFGKNSVNYLSALALWLPASVSHCLIPTRNGPDKASHRSSLLGHRGRERHAENGYGRLYREMTLPEGAVTYLLGTYIFRQVREVIWGRGRCKVKTSSYRLRIYPSTNNQYTISFSSVTKMMQKLASNSSNSGLSELGGLYHQ